MCKTLENLLEKLDSVDIEDMDDGDEYVNKDGVEDLIRQAFELGRKSEHDSAVKFYHTLDKQNKVPLNKYLLVKFDGEHEGGEFQFCRLIDGSWRTENGEERFPTWWSYLEKPE